jgi:hypothetical protein
MPYDIRQNYRECNGYAVVGPDGTVRGCHPSNKDAEQQRAALYAVEDDQQKAEQPTNNNWQGLFFPRRG